MSKIGIVVTRLENVPASELSIPSEPRIAPCGYRAAFEIQSQEFVENAALTLELQLQSPPAIQVKDLAPYLLGYLEGLLRSSIEGSPHYQNAFDLGFAAARPKP